MNSAPISVGIPTFGRGLEIATTIERLMACDPAPSEIIVHVDGSDGQLEAQLAMRFPTIRLLSSKNNVGPGGGRHRCIQAASHPIFSSFDDDSWPIDSDFFARVVELFAQFPQAAILAASIFARDEPTPPRTEQVRPLADYIGCGYALRTSVYRQTSGHIDRACPYGIEEVDLAMQLHALDWRILGCGTLRVFHNTRWVHHASSTTVAGTLQNIALRTFIRYPAVLWPYGFLQLGNVIVDAIKRRRFKGLLSGLVGIPYTLAHYRASRRPLTAAIVRSYFKARLISS